jgi:sugar phosphate isomerase/epimerase
MLGFKIDNHALAHKEFEENLEMYLTHPFEFGLESYGENRQNFIFGRKIDFNTQFFKETLIKYKHPNAICHITLTNKVLNIAEKAPEIWLYELKEELNFAYTLNAKYVILHGTSRERKTNQLDKVIDNICTNSQKLMTVSPIPFCIENSYEDLEFYEQLFEKLPKKVGFCCDIGHFKVHDKGYGSVQFQQRLTTFLHKLNKEGRIIHFHIHDNNGLKDQHLTLLEGEIQNENDLQIKLVKDLLTEFGDKNFIMEFRNVGMNENILNKNRILEG